MTTMQDLLAKNAAGLIYYKAGETAKGTVIDANPSRILLALPGGVTGIITKKEASGYGVEDEPMEAGTIIEATVIDPENEQGLVMLSLRRASQDMIWAELNDLLEEERSVKVKIFEANKGGLMAKYKGLKSFLPVSQLMPLNYPRVDGANGAAILSKLQEHVGKEFVVRIINVDREEGKIIISEKSAFEDQAKSTIKDLQVGDIVKGEVSGIVKFGIFVTFGGVEGLVHLSELDWGLVSDPAKEYSLGDKVEVMVIGIDGEKLSLSIKRLKEDPWLGKVEKYNVGDIVTGKILRWNVRGVFIELESDVQGVFEVEDFGVDSATELKLKAGDDLSGKILNIDVDSHKIELKKLDAEENASVKETAEEEE